MVRRGRVLPLEGENHREGHDGYEGCILSRDFQGTPCAFLPLLLLPPDLLVPLAVQVAIANANEVNPLQLSLLPLVIYWPTLTSYELRVSDFDFVFVSEADFEMSMEMESEIDESESDEINPKRVIEDDVK